MSPRKQPRSDLTMAEAAALLGVTRDAARKRLQRAGKAYRVGGRWLVTWLALEYLLPHANLHGDRGRHVTMAELAAKRGTTTGAARKWCNRHRLTQKMHGRWVVDTADLAYFVSEGRRLC